MNDVANTLYIAWCTFLCLVIVAGIVWDQVELRRRRARLDVSQRETAPMRAVREPVGR